MEPVACIWDFRKAGGGEEGFNPCAVLGADIVAGAPAEEEGGVFKLAGDLWKTDDVVHFGLEYIKVQPPALFRNIQ